jgi:hypothetical protein
MRTGVALTASVNSPTRSRLGPTSTLFHGMPKLSLACLFGHRV